MTLLVRDEEDIVEANLDFHLSFGVDFVVATDNGSSDATPEILRRYEKDGVLHLIREPSQDYSQHRWVTRMARMAASRFGADWVINNDADEFWIPRASSLTEALATVPRVVDVVVAQRHNMVTHRQRPSGPELEHPVRPELGQLPGPAPRSQGRPPRGSRGRGASRETTRSSVRPPVRSSTTVGSRSSTARYAASSSSSARSSTPGPPTRRTWSSPRRWAMPGAVCTSGGREASSGRSGTSSPPPTTRSRPGWPAEGSSRIGGWPNGSVSCRPDAR